jgi:hypothetical protein
MSTKITHTGYIKKGCLFLNSKGRFKGELKDFPDCDVELIIKKRGKRSNPQNSYYWSVIVHEIKVALKEMGTRMDNEQVHEFLKFHFNKQYIHNEHGEVITEYGGSTTGMNKEEFSEYINSIMEWASEKLGIAISPAGSQTSFFDKAA